MPAIDYGRLKPWFGDPLRTSAPVLPGYVPAAHERFNMAKGTIAGFVLFPVWTFLFTVSIGMLGGRTEYDASATLANGLLAVIVAFILVPFLHELVHGTTAVLFGVRPSYGIGPGFAYTTFRDPVGRAAYLIIGLAPIIILSVASVLLASRWNVGAGWLLLFAVINAGGAVGDLWMSWRVLRQPRSAMFFDLADGFAVFVPDPDAGQTEQLVSTA